MLKYERVFNELKVRIQDGTLKEGEKIPSIDSLMIQYGCSKSTVVKGLELLKGSGYIYSVPKSGFYVLKKGFSVQEESNNKFDLATSIPSWKLYPYQDFQRCINKAIDTYQQELFLYGTPQGLPSLIKVSRELLENYFVYAKNENISITSGIQQAISLLLTIPFPSNKKTILIEQPSYHVIMDYLRLINIPVYTIKRDSFGIDLDHLEYIFKTKNIKLYYTMSRFDNPLGTSYSSAVRRKIAYLANKYDVYIVEDDYLADFEYPTISHPIHYFDTNEHVIYLKSFSKIMFPGLRLGLVVLPTELIKTFEEHKRITFIDGSMISQAALEIYIESGMFLQHVKKVRNPYIERTKLLHQFLQNYSATSELPDHLYVKPSSLCMKTHINLPSKINMTLLYEYLHKRNVLIQPIDQHYLNIKDKEKILKLNVSNIEEDMIEESIHIIFEGLKEKRNYYI